MYTEKVTYGGEIQMYHKLSTGSPVRVLVNVAGQVGSAGRNALATICLYKCCLLLQVAISAGNRQCSDIRERYENGYCC